MISSCIAIPEMNPIDISRKYLNLATFLILVKIKRNISDIIGTIMLSINLHNPYPSISNPFISLIFNILHWLKGIMDKNSKGNPIMIPNIRQRA